MSRFENVDAAIVPYRMAQDVETKEWVAHCKFCPFESRRSNGPINAGVEVIKHAKGDGDHYDAVSGLYYPPIRLKEVREQTRQRRKILGSHEDTVNLNRAGL